MERLRWLATDSPTPCTADVSAKSWVLLMLGGATAGASTAMSRKLRPFSGRLFTSCPVMVVTTCVRADSSRSRASAATSTLAVTPDTVSDTGRSKAAPAFSVKSLGAGSKPGWLTTTSYGPTRR